MDAALADYNKAIQLDRKLAIVYFNRGQLNFSAQKYAEAVADYSKAIELKTDPKMDDIFFARGNAKMKLKDFAGAETDFKQAIRFNSHFDEARTNLTTAEKLSADSRKK